MANEHVFRNSLIITGSVSSSVGFYGDGTGLTGITAIAEWDGTRDGNASITGSLIVSGSGVNVDFINTTGVSGSFSGSFAGSATGTFAGDGTNLTGVTATIPAGVVSGSTQISYTGITDVPSGIVSSSAQFNNITSPFSGSFTGSFTGNGSGLINLPLPSGVVSGSGQISYTGITSVPTNIVSSSAQFITLTSPFTGSFTGSFTGDGAGLTGVVGETSTQIFQTGSGIAGSIIPNSTLSFTNIASGQYSTVIGGNFSTASADYSTVLGGRANKASATYAVAGGQGSCATGVASVAIGSGNVADAAYSVVLGRDNQTSTADTDASILGGRNHVIGESETSAGSVIAGGYTNVINGYSSGILAGEDNTVSGPYSGIIGGCSNTVAHTGSVALGGCNITVDRDNATFTPHLYISGSGTDVAAGDYAGIAQLAIRTVNPTSPKAGMLMVSGSSSSPNLYFYTNSSWTQLN